MAPIEQRVLSKKMTRTPDEAADALVTGQRHFVPTKDAPFPCLKDPKRNLEKVEFGPAPLHVLGNLRQLGELRPGGFAYHIGHRTDVKALQESSSVSMANRYPFERMRRRVCIS